MSDKKYEAAGTAIFTGQRKLTTKEAGIELNRLYEENKKLKKRIDDAIYQINGSEPEDIGYNALCALGVEC